ncbi:MAG: hypothetical protein QF752_08780 [Planctomycetota bacterium]|nr:hypothetical protein [Planctomycetota bacterium]
MGASRGIVAWVARLNNSVFIGFSLFLPIVLFAQDEDPSDRIRYSDLIVSAEILKVDSQELEVGSEGILKAYRIRCQLQEVLAGPAPPTTFVVHAQRRVGSADQRKRVAWLAGRQYLFYLCWDSEHIGGYRLVNPDKGAERVFEGTVAEVKRLLRVAETQRGSRIENSDSGSEGARERTVPRASTRSDSVCLRILSSWKEIDAVNEPALIWVRLIPIGQEAIRLSAGSWIEDLRVEVSLEKSPGVWKLIEPHSTPDEARFPTEPPVIRLKGGQALDRAFDLRRLYPPLLPGRYRVSARIPVATFLENSEGSSHSGTTAGVIVSETIYLTIRSGRSVDASPDRVRFVRSGVCSGGHLEELIPGTCRRCEKKSRSKQRILCLFCARELGICGLCARQSKR